MTAGVLASGANIDFMIHGVFSYHFFGHEVWITTTHICLLIILCVIIGLAAFAGHIMKHAALRPGAAQNVVELVVESLDNLVHGEMGKHAGKFANYIGTVFIFILVCNISGLFGLRPPTADYGVTLPLGLATFFLIHFNKFRYRGVKGVVADLCDPWPFWAPVNLIGYIAVPISLSLRLFANVLSGVVMMSLVYGLLRLLAIGWPAVLHAYFDLFSGAIQTYVFCMLTMTYLSDAIGDN